MQMYRKLHERVQAANSVLCVGLDSDYHKLPKEFKEHAQPQFTFNKAIIDATHDLVCAYKPNLAYYEARGPQGLQELVQTMEYLQTHYPQIVTIADAKRADIDATNNGYVEALFDRYGFDAVTLHPYLGKEALKPFLAREDKASIILCRTSNPGAGEFQDLEVRGVPLWRHVARTVASTWNERRNCMLVMGATYPEEMQVVRQDCPDIPFLIPGIGTQGGDIQQTVHAGQTETGEGMIINVGRAVIFAHPSFDPDAVRSKATQYRDEINQYRSTV